MPGDTEEGAEYLDIRDLIERIEELRTDRDNAEEEAAEGHAAWSFGAEEREELAKLESFVEEMKGYGGDHQWEGDWYPVTLIREDRFTDYAQEFAEEIGGAEMRDAKWPFNCIDWEKAADQLRIDYSAATYGETEYLYR